MRQHIRLTFGLKMGQPSLKTRGSRISLVSELTLKVSTLRASFGPAGLKVCGPLSQAVGLLVESALQCGQVMLSGLNLFLSGGELALGGAIRDGDPTIAVVGTECHLVHFAEAMFLTGPAAVIDGVGIRGVPTRRGAIDASRANGQARLSDIRRTHQKESARIALPFDGRLPGPACAKRPETPTRSRPKSWSDLY